MGPHWLFLCVPVRSHDVFHKTVNSVFCTLRASTGQSIEAGFGCSIDYVAGMIGDDGYSYVHTRVDFPVDHDILGGIVLCVLLLRMLRFV